MKILLIGHGRMGHLMERTALAQGDQLGGIVDVGNLGDLETIGRVADVVIDFSAPAALPAVARYVRQTGTPLLSGVTGLSGAELEIFTDLGRAAPVIHSANYSLGVAVFRRALAEVAGVLSDFDVEIVETHHNQKADAPSGTARLLLRWTPATSAPRSTAATAFPVPGTSGRSAYTPSGAAPRRGPTR